MIEFETLQAGTIAAHPNAILFTMSKNDDYFVAISNGMTWEIDRANYEKIHAALASKV